MVQTIWFPNQDFWFSHVNGKHSLISHRPFLLWRDMERDEELARYNQDTPYKGNLYSYVYWKSIEKKKDKGHPPFRWCIQIHTYPFTPSPPPPSPPHLTHTHTPLLPKNSSKSKLYPLAKGHVCVTFTQEDSSQAKTYLTVKTSQVCKCKLFVSVSFLDYAENFLLKVKLKGNKFYVIYLYSFSKKYRETF